MVAPIDYTLNVQNPLQAFSEAAQLGAGLANIRAQQQARGLELQQKQAEIERQQQIADRANALVTNPAAGFSDYQALALMLPAEQQKSVLEWYKANQGDVAQKRLEHNGQIAAALESQNPQIGIDMLHTAADAARNSNKPDEAAVYEQWAQDAAENPSAVRASIMTLTAQVPGGKEVIETYSKSESERRLREGEPTARKEAEAKAAKEAALAKKAEVEAQFAPKLQQAGLTESNYRVKHLQNQMYVATERLKLDQQTTAATVAEKMASIQDKLTTLPAPAQTLVNESATNAAVGKQQATKLNDLAGRLEKVGGGYGAAANSSEWLKKITGNQDELSMLRKEYVRLRNSEVIRNRAPGAFSDKDMQVALEGFLPETADAKQLASFLRGTAKLSEIDAAVNNAKADWLANNKGTLKRAGESFIAGDFTAKPGETFADFSVRIAKEIDKKYARGGSPEAPEIPQWDASGRRIDAGAAAAQGQSVRAQADAILSGGR